MNTLDKKRNETLSENGTLRQAVIDNNVERFEGEFKNNPLIITSEVIRRLILDKDIELAVRTNKTDIIEKYIELWGSKEIPNLYNLATIALSGGCTEMVILLNSLDSTIYHKPRHIIDPLIREGIGKNHDMAKILLKKGILTASQVLWDLYIGTEYWELNKGKPYHVPTYDNIIKWYRDAGDKVHKSFPTLDTKIVREALRRRATGDMQLTLTESILEQQIEQIAKIMKWPHLNIQHMRARNAATDIMYSVFEMGDVGDIAVCYELLKEVSQKTPAYYICKMIAGYEVESTKYKDFLSKLLYHKKFDLLNFFDTNCKKFSQLYTSSELVSILYNNVKDTMSHGTKSDYDTPEGKQLLVTIGMSQYEKVVDAQTYHLTYMKSSPRKFAKLWNSVADKGHTIPEIKKRCKFDTSGLK